MSSDPSPPLNVRLKSPRVVSVTAVRFTPRLMHTHLMACTKKGSVVDIEAVITWERAWVALRSGARPRALMKTQACQRRSWPGAAAINPLEGETKVGTERATVLTSSESFSELFRRCYNFISFCFASHLPSFFTRLVPFFSTGKVQVKSSDIQVGDLIIVEKVRDF